VSEGANKLYKYDKTREREVVISNYIKISIQKSEDNHEILKLYICLFEYL